MAYYRGTRTGKKFTARKMTKTERGTTKSANIKLKALQASVKKLTAVSYDKVSMRLNESISSGTFLPYYQYHLNNIMNTWTPVFGYDSNDFSNVNKIYVNSYKIDARLSQDNEADLIWYTAFVVSLKDDAADSSLFDPATGLLTLSSGIHYTTLGANGKAMISPRAFNIHGYKRFSMGGRPNDQSNPVVKDLSFTIKPKQKMITNPRGNVFGVGGLSFPKDPSKNYYMLLFNDDSGADLQSNKITVSGVCSAAIPN